MAVSKTDAEKEIKNIKSGKATTKNNIPPRILKESQNVSSNFLQEFINNTIISGKFPDSLKLADVTPVFKKKNPFDKTKSRPVSVLLTTSKIFEKLREKQLNHYIQNHFSPYLCGYQKGYSTQQALLVLIESWKKKV